MCRGRDHLVRICFAIVVALACHIGSAAAEIYPTRPITLIAPFPPGGPADALARILAEPMSQSLGQPVVIENVPGAGGNIGTGRLARATPDGYTIGIGQWGTHVVNAVTYTGLHYDVLADFEPIALLANTPQLIIARKDFPASNVKEFVAWLRNNPDKGMAGTVGAAGGAQVAGIFFQRATQTRFAFIPYRGGAAVMNDLVSGHVDFMFDQGANAIAQVRSGALKAFAVMAKVRWALAPEIPTTDEEGLPGLYVAFWYGLWGPKDTPKDIVAMLNGAVVKALADDNVRQRLAAIGLEIWPRDQQTPEALLAHHKAEIEKWWPIIRGTNLRAE
jgi:tripartite-type tricarboxylate transporter receptor subunit TctC